MKNPIKYFKHIVKDPINTISEANTRKKEIMPFFYCSLGALVLGLTLQIITEIEFIAFFSFIAFVSTVLFSFLLWVIAKAKQRLEVLTCNNCHALTTIETSEEFKLHFSYGVTMDKAGIKSEKQKDSPRNGVYPCVNVSAISSALVFVNFTCPYCGEEKPLKFKAIPFKCHIEQKNVTISDYKHVRKTLENAVKAVVKEYNNPDTRKQIPYTFTSTKNPNFENRFSFKGSTADDAFPEYKGVKIDFHKDAEEMLEHYFVLNEITVNAQLIDPNNTVIKRLFKSIKGKRTTRQKNEFPKPSQAPRTRRTPSDSEASERYVPIHKDDIENPNVQSTSLHRSSESQRSQSNPKKGNSSGNHSSSSKTESTATSRERHSKGRYAKPKQRNSRKIILIIIVLCIALILGGLGYVLLAKAPHKEATVLTPTESAATQLTTAPQQETDGVTEIKDNTPVQEKELSINEYVGYWRISGNQNKELTIHSGDSNTVHFSLWYAAKGTITDASAQLEGNIASFSLAVDGAVLKGMLTFNQNAITVQITHSTHASIPIEVMEFTELYMTSQAYVEETEAATEPDNAPLSPYTFKIKDDFHGIYSDPSYESNYVDGIPTGKYTIVEEQYDDRNNLWGKLESGAGWICLTGINESKATAGYLLPYSSVRLLTEKDISSLTTSQLRFARNEIFARHGRLFDDKGLQDYFNKKAWYSGYIKPSDFSESMLSDIELKNVAFIREHQQSASSNTEQEEVKGQQVANAAWQTAYLEHLEAFEDKDYCSYRLVYVDADQIPELFISGPAEAAGSDIYSYKEGKIIHQHLERLGGGYFIPDKGLIYNCNGNMGYYTTNIYQLGNSGFTTLFDGLQEERYSVDENGEEQFVFEYIIDGHTVSEDEFNAAVAEFFDLSNALALDEHVVSYAQIIQEIQNW